jgi:hypothetical protein
MPDTITPTMAFERSEIYQELKTEMPENIKDYQLKSFDHGLFTYELQGRVVDPDPTNAARRQEHKKGDLIDQIVEGTYAGTQLALTEMYSRIDRRYVLTRNILYSESQLELPIS